MRVKWLSLKNIGPFVEAEIDFAKGTDKTVTLITGENGTGKSIILDAIRGMFGNQYAKLERDIRRQQRTGDAEIELFLEATDLDVGPENKLHLKSIGFEDNRVRSTLVSRKHADFLNNIISQVQRGSISPNWVIDYWPSVLAAGSYKVNSLTSPQHQYYLKEALQGIREKANITQLICHFDYLRDSRDQQEQATGERLYEILEQIIILSLLDGGKLSYVARSTYEPMVIQNGQEVSLAHLSSGNSYLIQNMVNLLSKMHAVHFLRGTPLSELCQTPGLLLIDEAENQLHPKWQKRFIRSILDIFPNLQIIATTHSPFIISSIPDAQLLVCQAKDDHCVVVDETAEYSNKPVDEILMSPLFEDTQPFNEEISQLIIKREEAIKAGDEKERAAIEAKLQNLNPEYFGYFDIDKLLNEVIEEGHTT